MNTNAIIQSRSSWSRIVQMLKVDLYAQRRATLYALGALFILIFIFPRLPLIIWGVSYEDWSHDISFGGPIYSATMLGISALFGTFMGIIYINRRVLHARPIPFALLPAKLWEKIVALALFAFGLYISSILIFALCDLLNFATIANYRTSIGKGFSLLNTGFLTPSELSMDSFVTFLIYLCVSLSIVLSAISFRQLRVGLFVCLFAWVFGLIIFFTLGIYILTLLEAGSSLDALHWISYGSMGLLALINGTLIWGIYRRLKRLEC
ncbi:MAG: hypothetical protein Q4A61_03675 [Porphyromonadaceae bacterium]|nr:hypothetical protein [Porphyromonadaceae bacterium]